MEGSVPYVILAGVQLKATEHLTTRIYCSFVSPLAKQGNSVSKEHRTSQGEGTSEVLSNRSLTSCCMLLGQSRFLMNLTSFISKTSKDRDCTISKIKQSSRSSTALVREQLKNKKQNKANKKSKANTKPQKKTKTKPKHLPPQKKGILNVFPTELEEINKNIFLFRTVNFTISNGNIPETSNEFELKLQGTPIRLVLKWAITYL